MQLWKFRVWIGRVLKSQTKWIWLVMVACGWTVDGPDEALSALYPSYANNKRHEKKRQKEEEKEWWPHVFSRRLKFDPLSFPATLPLCIKWRSKEAEIAFSSFFIRHAISPCLTWSLFFSYYFCFRRVSWVTRGSGTAFCDCSFVAKNGFIWFGTPAPLKYLSHKCLPLCLREEKIL